MTDIVWTDPAKADLQDIYDFYWNVSASLAEKMTMRIVLRAEVLLDGLPLRWPIEPLLEHRAQGHRFLLVGNYKIIFRIDGELAVIDSVFDARKNPTKLGSRLN